MAENIPGQSSDEESLKTLFDQAIKQYEDLETNNEPTNSDAVQLTVKSTISKFEKATHLVSMSGMFSSNESLEELPTETLRYLLLPALLGTLSLKMCGRPRKEVIVLAEIYFRDFLQRCKDYGVTDIEVPQPAESETTVARPQSEQAKIANMVQSRQAKIQRYKETKELKDKLITLTKAMESPIIDEETKREYFTTLLVNYVNQAVDELDSIEQEKPILEYIAKRAADPKPSKTERSHSAPLRPVIITRDALQKAVYGLGYPALPTLTIEEFYDQRVREGTFPGACNIPNQTIQHAEVDPDEAEQVRKERLQEADDPEELARLRAMDEYKDEHRRGEGNRHNRS